MEIAFIDTFWFTYILLPLLIFLSRIIDVSLDTLRIVFISKGNKNVAPFLGFFEILIWLVAITRIMQNLDNITCYIAYAGGFATGNYIGLKIEERLAIGIQMIRIITQKSSTPLITELREKGFVLTSVIAEGQTGEVHLIFLIVQRQRIAEIIELINKFNPKAFYAIEDVKSVNVKSSIMNQKRYNAFTPRWMRKGR